MPITLPDRWDRSRPNYEGAVWYRFSLPAPVSPPEPWGLMIGRASMNVEVYVNGQYFGTGDRVTEPAVRAWNRPQYFLLPLRAIESGRFEVLIRVYGYRHSGAGLSPVMIAADSYLRPIYERSTTLQVWSPLLVSAVSIVVGIYALFYWRMIPGQGLFGLFGMTAIAWALRNVDFFARTAPISVEAWELIVGSAMGSYVVLLTVFALRFFGFRSRLNLLLLGLFLSIGPVCALLFRRPGSLDVLYWWTLLLAPMCLALAALLIVQAVRLRDVERIAVGGVYALHAAALAHDSLITLGVRPFESPYIAHFPSLLLFGVILWLMIRRYKGSLHQVEDLNRNLESRIALRERQLSDSYVKLREVEVRTERDKAMLNERQRIMRDMHDGVGSQLVAALDNVRRGRLSAPEIEERLTDVLDDLRLVIDSLEPGHADLLALLGNFRYRMERRLRASGIELTWRAGDVPEKVNLDSSQALQLLRVVQEAFSNIIKHANARQINVEIAYRQASETVELTIADNGVGFDPATVRRGNGLNNIEARVAAIGASMRLSSDSTGTRLVIVLRA